MEPSKIKVEEFPIEIKLLKHLEIYGPCWWRPMGNRWNIQVYGTTLEFKEWHQILINLKRQGLATKSTYQFRPNKTRTTYQISSEGRELLKEMQL